MKVSVLFSGGKDSTFALYLAQQQGWTISNLLTIHPRNNSSYMYHHPNVQWTSLQAESLGLSIRTADSEGEKDGELADLERLMASEDVEGFVSGAIASDYQWSRMNEICHRLGKPLFSPLWRKDQRMLLHDMLEAGFRVLVVGTYAEGLDESWLGREIDSATLEELCELGRRHRLSVSGEGGELETFVIDGPNFTKGISVVEAWKEVSRDSGSLTIRKAVLAPRTGGRTPC